MKYIVILLIFFIFSIFSTIEAQSSIGGHPYILIKKELLQDKIPSIQRSIIDKEKIISNDFDNGYKNRCAIAEQINIDFFKMAKKLNLPSGDEIYLLKIKTRNSFGLSILLDQINLPHDARVSFVHPKSNQFQGVYSNFKKSSHKYIDFLKGNEFILEVLIPYKSLKSSKDLRIKKVYHVYRPRLLGWNTNSIRDIGFNTSYECHINAACPDGDPFRDQINATVRIQMINEESISFCSGSLINNTRNDNTPYLLSAEHCVHGQTPIYDQWQFDYHYEVNTCQNFSIEPKIITSIGCDLVAKNKDSDFLLVKLFDNIPTEAHPYLSGWNNQPTHFPDTSLLIQHPNADIKKLAFDNNPIKNYPNQIYWPGAITSSPNSHFQVYFDHGTQQPGASGGPLLDNKGYIIGQLHGGIGQDSTCSIERKDYFGKLSFSWQTNDTIQKQLKHWLDPINTNISILDGAPYINNVQSTSGEVITFKNLPVPNVRVNIQVGSNTYTTYTDLNGRYSIDYINPNNLNINLSFYKDGDPQNGLNIVDLIYLTRHILFLDPFNDPIKETIADTDDSNTLNIADIIYIRRVILRLIDEFPNQKTWLFFDNNITIYNNDPITTKAAKIGDIDFSVNPSKE